MLNQPILFFTGFRSYPAEGIFAEPILVNSAELFTLGPGIADRSERLGWINGDITEPFKWSMAFSGGLFVDKRDPDATSKLCRETVHLIGQCRIPIHGESTSMQADASFFVLPYAVPISAFDVIVERRVSVLFDMPAFDEVRLGNPLLTRLAKNYAKTTPIENGFPLPICIADGLEDAVGMLEVGTPAVEGGFHARLLLPGTIPKPQSGTEIKSRAVWSVARPQSGLELNGRAAWENAVYDYCTAEKTVAVVI